MDHLCLLRKAGPAIHGNSRYYTHRCPGQTPAFLVTQRELNPAACQGSPTGCLSLTSLVHASPGQPLRAPADPETVTAWNDLYITQDAAQRGIASKIAWNTPPLDLGSTSSTLYILNCRFPDPHSGTERFARAYLGSMNHMSPAGIPYPPLNFGFGLELDGDSIPETSHDTLVSLNDSQVVAIGTRARFVEFETWNIILLTT